MIDIFRMKAMSVMNKLMRSDTFALIRYNNEEGGDHSLEVIIPTGRKFFTPCEKSHKEMDEFMEEL